MLSGRCVYSGGGRDATFCDELRDSLGGWPGSCLRTISPIFSFIGSGASELGEDSFFGGRGDREEVRESPFFK